MLTAISDFIIWLAQYIGAIPAKLVAILAGCAVITAILFLMLSIVGIAADLLPAEKDSRSFPERWRDALSGIPKYWEMALFPASFLFGTAWRFSVTLLYCILSWIGYFRAASKVGFEYETRTNLAPAYAIRFEKDVRTFFTGAKVRSDGASLSSDEQRPNAQTPTRQTDLSFLINKYLDEDPNGGFAGFKRFMVQYGAEYLPGKRMRWQGPDKTWTDKIAIRTARNKLSQEKVKRRNKSA